MAQLEEQQKEGMMGGVKDEQMSWRVGPGDDG